MIITQTLYQLRSRPYVMPMPGQAGCRLRNSHGFTVVELLAALAIAATLTAIAVPQITSSIENARVAAAIGDIHTLQNDIATFEGLNDRLPNDLAELGRGGMIDPWGFDYVYVNFRWETGSDNQRTWASVARKDRFLVPLNTFYDLYSPGFDGATRPSLQTPVSQDDVVRAGDGDFVGKGSEF